MSNNNNSTRDVSRNATPVPAMSVPPSPTPSSAATTAVANRKCVELLERIQRAHQAISRPESLPALLPSKQELDQACPRCCTQLNNLVRHFTYGNLVKAGNCIEAHSLSSISLPPSQNASAAASAAAASSAAGVTRSATSGGGAGTSVRTDRRAPASVQVAGVGGVGGGGAGKGTGTASTSTRQQARPASRQDIIHTMVTSDAAVPVHLTKGGGGGQRKARLGEAPVLPSWLLFVLYGLVILACIAVIVVLFTRKDMPSVINQRRHLQGEVIDPFVPEPAVDVQRVSEQQREAAAAPRFAAAMGTSATLAALASS